MKRSKTIRASDDFIDFIKNIRREFRLRSDIEATRLIARRRSRLMKASIMDFFPFMLILLVFSLCSMIGYYLITQVETGFAAEPLIPNQTMDVIGIAKSTIGYFDDVFLFVLFGLAIAMIVGGYYLEKVHPIFIGVGIFILVFVLIVSGVVSNAFLELSEAEDLSTVVSHFSKTVLAWKHMPVIILLIAVMLFIIMYSKPKKEGGGGFT